MHDRYYKLTFIAALKIGSGMLSAIDSIGPFNADTGILLAGLQFLHRGKLRMEEFRRGFDPCNILRDNAIRI